MSDKVVNEVLRASLMQFYSPLPCLKRAIVCLEEGDADAALEEVACVGDDAADIQTCEAFILKGFAEILSGSSLFAGSALRNALEYWADMRVSPKAPLLYSHSDIQMMVTILTDKSLDKDIKLAKAMALLPERFRPADTPVKTGSVVSQRTKVEAISAALGTARLGDDFGEPMSGL